ncbi:hypothetical protein A9320_27170 [Ruegeria sp. PBVC088]|nr:hypothetical protein A9320_27170 [Ruegeria sp. PBVC088]
MDNLPPWTRILEDLRVAAVLKADDTRYFLGMNDRGNAAAAAILGMEDVPAQHLDDLIASEAFLAEVAIEGSGIERAAHRSYRLVSAPPALQDIDVSDERAEGTDWLSYFLSALPREAMGGLDHTGVYLSPDAPLQILLTGASATLAIAEVVQGILCDGQLEIGFSAQEIATLGGLDVRSVRNVMGPRGNKPIRTTAALGPRADYVEGDPLDALEWLAGRRGFSGYEISSDWVEQHLAQINTPTAVAAIPMVFAWAQGVTTATLAKRLSWPAERVSGWARSRDIRLADAAALAEAAGLDGTAYRALIERTSGAHNPQ